MKCTIVFCAAVFLSIIFHVNGQSKCWHLGIQPVTTLKFDIGESPYWCARRQKLFFVDITNASYHYYTPLTGKVGCVFITDCPSVSFIIPVKGQSDNYIIGCGNKVNLIKWDGSNESGMLIRTLTEIEIEDGRLNVGKADLNGELFTGTMSNTATYAEEDNSGSLYRIGKNLTPEKLIDGITLPSGIEWTSDRSKMFFNDMSSGVVKQYIFHKDNGTISNENVFFDFKANNISGYPAGLAIDLFGNVWVSSYKGGKILKIDGTTGELLCCLELPVTGVTGIAFGGILMNTLYVTTSSNKTVNSAEESEDAGSLFSVRGLFTLGRFPNQFHLD